MQLPATYNKNKYLTITFYKLDSLRVMGGLEKRWCSDFEN